MSRSNELAAEGGPELSAVSEGRRRRGELRSDLGGKEWEGSRSHASKEALGGIASFLGRFLLLAILHADTTFLPFSSLPPKSTQEAKSRTSEEPFRLEGTPPVQNASVSLPSSPER